jgi:hypothetical protein
MKRYSLIAFERLFDLSQPNFSFQQQRQGGLNPEDALPGWDDPSGLRPGRPSAVGFVARLAALIPKPGINLTRYHGVLAPNHRFRGLVTPAKRGRGVKSISNAEVRSPAERHAVITWAQRFKRVFSIDTRSVRKGPALVMLKVMLASTPCAFHRATCGGPLYVLA